MKPLFLSLIFLIINLPTQATEFDHSIWNKLLNKHVISINKGSTTQVNYGAFSQDRSQLKDYLNSLKAISSKRFESWSEQEQLAFLINAYNAWTVELILTKYPEIESIKELGSWLQSPWKKSFIPLLGKTRSLDDIEHGLIRAEGKYEDPRIHFAVNCASIGCPALATNAYTGANLDKQLDSALQSFLSDRSRNRLKGKTLEVSKIFDWYSEDFERNWRGYKTLPQFFIQHSAALGLNKQNIQDLKSGTIKIEFLDYNWQLNDTH